MGRHVGGGSGSSDANRKQPSERCMAAPDSSTAGMPARFQGPATQQCRPTCSVRWLPMACRAPAMVHSQSSPITSAVLCASSACLPAAPLAWKISGTCGYLARTCGHGSRAMRCMVERGKGLQAPWQGHCLSTASCQSLPAVATCHRPCSAASTPGGPAPHSRCAPPR